MNTAEFLSLYDQQMRIHLRLPETVFENTGRIVRDHSTVENAGFIDYARLDESSADAEIAAQIAYYASLNMPFTWKVYDHDRPVDLRQRLASHGFKIGEPSTLMALDLQAPPAGLLTMEIPPCIQRITDDAGINAMVDVEESVYGSPREWLRKRLLSMQRNTPHLLSLYAAVVDKKIVSAAWIIYYEGTQFASLLGGATLPEHRSHGYYTALLAVRAREALSRGVRSLVVDASPMSAPVLAKHGFEPLEQTTYCRWSPVLSTL
jgi:GNAT superfamily N-acetyltransferase